MTEAEKPDISFCEACGSALHCDCTLLGETTQRIASIRAAARREALESAAGYHDENARRYRLLERDAREDKDYEMANKFGDYAIQHERDAGQIRSLIDTKPGEG